MADNTEVNNALNVASQIVDATSNTNTQATSNTPEANVSSDTTPVEVQSTNQTNQTQTNQEGVVNQEQQQPTEQTTAPTTTPTVPVAQTETVSTPVGGATNASYLKEIYDSNSDLANYLKKQGFGVNASGDNLFVNNTQVDWQALGITKDASGNFTGTQAAYDQLVSNIKSAGYTTPFDFNQYAQQLGYQIDQNSLRHTTVNGKEVDFSQYASQGMKLVNGIWVGTENAYKQIIKDVEAQSDKTLATYLQQNGISFYTVGKDIYVNNKLVNYKDFGLKKVFDNVVGNDAQYKQIISDIKNQGYTNNQVLKDYVSSQGLSITYDETNGYIGYIDGKPIDLSQYNLTDIPDLGYGGPEETYQQIMDDINSRAASTLDQYSIDNGLSFNTFGGNLFINNKQVSIDELRTFGIQVINGKLYGSEAQYKALIGNIQSQGYTSNLDLNSYLKNKGLEGISEDQNGVVTVKGKELDLNQFGLTKVDGKWVGSETAYSNAVQFAKSESNLTMDAYLNGKASGAFKKSTDGKMYLNGRPITNEDLASFGIQNINGELRGADASFESILNAVKNDGYTTNLTMDNYILDKGVTVTKDGDYYVIDGKPIDIYKYNLTNVDGQLVGSQAVYDKIKSDAVALASDDLATALTSNGLDCEVLNGNVYVNGTNVTSAIQASGLQLVNGKVYGTEAQLRVAESKVLEPYGYTSAYDEEIQNALDEINNFQMYQTPQETLDLLNQLIATSQEKFNYDPGTDSALKVAQQEAERQVREGGGTKGLLYSSGTLETVTRKAAELIPQFEQAAYARFQAEQTRVTNVLNAVMKWDEMQADRNMDQFTVMTTKFQTIMDLDARGLDQFKTLLDQRNADRTYELEQQKFALDKKTQETQMAWDTVNGLGYVDEASSAILGIPVGTQAAWVKQIEMEQQNALAIAEQQYENDVKLQQAQAEIDYALTEYKASLDDAANQKLAASQYEYDKLLQETANANAIAIAAQQNANALSIAQQQNANDLAIAQQQAANAAAIAQQSAANAIKLAQPAASSKPVLKYGSSGSSVSELQQALRNKGYNIAVDGSFGPATQAAVRSYQQSRGLTVDGVAGPQTWGSLLG